MTARFAAPAACPTGRDTSPDALRDVPGTTTPASPPAPRATAEQAAALRRDLEATGWGVDSVHHLLGDAADAALRREIRLPALRALRRALDEDRAAGAAPNPTAVLTALFMLGQTVSVAELDSALRRTRTRGALAMGLVEPAPDAGAGAAPRVRALVDLRPHEARDETGDVRWWIASDLGELATGAPLAPDHVLGIGGAGLALAALTPRRPVAAALDLGCGCGIQTLYLLRHADRVTATDVSERALAFTAFNAALAAVGPDRLELLAGSLLEPVAGRRFDLIVTNPPFVLTPPAVREAGLPLMEYRDAGRPVLPGLVAGLGEHLGVGAAAVMLGNWEHRRGRDWRRDVAGWVPDDLDAWVVEREAQDPVEYAALWLRDGGLAPERDLPRFEAALEAWIADFEARGVEGVGLGYLIVHRPDPDSDGAPRAPWRVLEKVATRPAGPLGEHVARCLEVRSGLAAMDDDAVAGLRPVTAPDVTEERHLCPGASEPDVILIRQGGGFGRVVEADAALAALVGVADGELSVAQIATAVAALTGADEAALRARMVAATRSLAAEGFVDL
ncbi:DUF7059 domain-containing protein [Actinomyces dentalis]|uniref:DUF7059 domain-containing protein n=1 Tax=Actinomyces dentalis TaxID=272548 RepID=UPI00047D6FF5|nr:methyltransferase [Actinomyces dentalis]